MESKLKWGYKRKGSIDREREKFENQIIVSDNANSFSMLSDSAMDLQKLRRAED